MENGKDNQFLWERFCRLGEMIGDGLHHEDQSISKEYRRLRNILIPETKEIERQQKIQRNKEIDLELNVVLKDVKCPDCKSDLTQNRSGSKKVHCKICKQCFKFKI